MSALYEQLTFELQRFNAKPHSIDTLFIGGGTPSTISPELYAPIFKLLEPYLKHNAEITTEANPNSASKSWLEGMKKLGVNRISFGVQSFNAGKLKALNRVHTPQQAIEAIQSADSIGFEHISLDLIYNYKGDTSTLLQSDIERAFTLPIDHISAYELTIEEHTKFATTPQVRQEDDNLAIFVAQSIQKRGFEHYEISNYGTYQSRHNQGYWRLENYIGAGAGAVGFLDDRRYYPQTDIESYIHNPLKISEEKLSEDELLTEKLFLGLRSTLGVNKSLLPTEIQKNADFLVREGKLILDNDKYHNTNLFLADEIVLFVLG